MRGAAWQPQSGNFLTLPHFRGLTKMQTVHSNIPAPTAARRPHLFLPSPVCRTEALKPCPNIFRQPVTIFSDFLVGDVVKPPITVWLPRLLLVASRPCSSSPAAAVLAVTSCHFRHKGQFGGDGGRGPGGWWGRTSSLSYTYSTLG